MGICGLSFLIQIEISLFLTWLVIFCYILGIWDLCYETIDFIEMFCFRKATSDTMPSGKGSCCLITARWEWKFMFSTWPPMTFQYTKVVFLLLGGGKSSSSPHGPHWHHKESLWGHQHCRKERVPHCSLVREVRAAHLVIADRDGSTVFDVGSTFLLLCPPGNPSLGARHCKLYHVGYQTFLYSYKYSWVLFWDTVKLHGNSLILLGFAFVIL